MHTTSQGETAQGELRRGLGLLDATTIVIGSMIGSGIFIAPSLMAGYIQTPGLIVLLWLVGGVLTVFAALSFAELSAIMPRAGGQYVFLREAYGPLISFLYGWTLFFVIQTGFIAAVGVAFAKYLGVFVPVFSEENTIMSIGSWEMNSAQVVAIASIVFLTGINIFGVRLGAIVQNVFTISKILALALLIGLSFTIGGGSASHFRPFVTPMLPEALELTFFAAFAVAMSKALFAYDAWASVTFVAEETREPEKNLPRALILGTGIVALVYTLANVAYLYMVPVTEMAQVPDNRIAAETAFRVMGTAGLTFITVAILISTFGCNNGLILAGPRVYYAMAKDALFFKRVSEIHPTYRTPVTSLIYQCIWASLLTLTGTYSDLLTYTAFASLLANVMTVVALFVLRRERPSLPRPYKVWGYPLVPLLYIAVAIFFIVYIFIGDPRNSGIGLTLILTGVPVFFYWHRKRG
jgi:APA family basic amino acid/polyamine antiporter